MPAFTGMTQDGLPFNDANLWSRTLASSKIRCIGPALKIRVFKSKRDPLGQDLSIARKNRGCCGLSIEGGLDLLELLLDCSGGDTVWLVLITLLVSALAAPALAQEEGTAAEALIQPGEPAAPGPAPEAPSGRVGRVSLVSGTVSVHTSQGWLDASLNFPVAAAGALRTGAGARAEIEIGDGTIDLAADSEIDIGKLDARAIRVAVVTGRIGVALRRLGDGESVEVKVSGEDVRLLRPGRYDIDAGAGRIAVSAEGAVSGSPKMAVTTIDPTAGDDFVEWCRSRDYDETSLAAPYYLSPYMTGFAELDGAGGWESTTEYGVVWVPTGLPADWAPYRYGHWRWIAPWGWTWIDDQPWGFVPSHYGRWAFVGERWAWVAGSFVARPEYMPAVVAFLGTAGVGLSVADSAGPGIGWFPLAPGEAYWPSYSRNLDYVRRLNQGDVSDLEAIQLDANGEPPLEVVDRHFANRTFASVVPRPVFVNGGAVAPALLSLPEQRLQNAPVLMGSPQVGPSMHPVAAAARAIAPPSHAEWVKHIAALVARSVHRAKVLQAAFAHLRAREPATRLRASHLRAPAYAQSTRPRHTILLRVAHVAPPPHGGGGKSLRLSSARHRG
jgi:hypothetical protein